MDGNFEPSRQRFALFRDDSDGGERIDARMTARTQEEIVPGLPNTVTDTLKISVCVLAICLARSGIASDVDSAFVDNASALVAIQLSSEVGDGLSRELVRKGMPKVDADALVFRVVDDAARCAVRRLKDHDLPEVVSFVDLLAKSEKMSAVTAALNEMYTREQLDAMQSEISTAVRECLDSSMRVPEMMPKRSGAVG